MNNLQLIKSDKFGATEEYGVMAMDKSPYSNKEIPSFRYNAKGVNALKALAKCYYLV